MKATWPAAVARRIGMGGEIATTITRVGMTLHIPCKRGGHVVDVKVRPGLEPNGVVKMMLNHGWTCGTNPTCPEHSRKQRKAPEPTQPEENKEHAEMATTAPPAPSDAARKAKRLIYQALEDYYDDVKKAYRPGYSDEKIAKETGASVEFVRQIRDTDFGPVGEPAELTLLKQDVEDLRLSFARSYNQAEAEIAKFKSRLAALCKSNGWPTPL